MARLPHDHPGVDTVRARLDRRGPRLRPRLPDDDRDLFSDGDPFRIVLDGTDRFARVDAGVDGRFLSGAYDTPDGARESSGTDRLAAWVDDRNLSPGDSVLIDVLEAGERYGLRAPGESAAYEQRSSRDEGLASIARQAERRREDSDGGDSG